MTPGTRPHISESNFARLQFLHIKNQSKQYLSSTRVLFLSTLFGLLITIVRSQPFSIPDQEATLGKLSFFPLPLPKDGVRRIQIRTEIGPGFVPDDWHSITKAGKHLVFVAVPLQEGSFFFHVDAKTTANNHFEDVFSFKVVKRGEQEKYCDRIIHKTFYDIEDLWKAVESEVPVSLKQEMEFSREPLSLMKRWSDSRFTVRSTKTENSRNFELIAYDCDESKEMLRDGPIPEENIPSGNIFLAESLKRTFSDDFPPSNHFRRHIPKIRATPVLLPDWMTLSPSLLSSNVEEPPSDTQEIPLTRVVPVFSSHATTEVSSLATPYLESLQVKSSHIYNHIPAIYSTPGLYSEIPTAQVEGLLTPTFGLDDAFKTPTPSLDLPVTSSTTDITPVEGLDVTDFESKELKPHFSVSASPSKIPEPSTTHTEIIPSSPVNIPVTPPIIYPNRGPSIKKRIPKLSLTAGRYWKYKIPSETFYDEEDGNTRNLKLTFLILDLASDREDSPPSDYWIQFDHENQMLFALPTERNLGKHKFTLVAVDKDGEPVTELLEVHVRQHPSFRAFHHVFTLYHVSWDNYKYPLLIEAASKVARKVAQVYGDYNLNAFTVQSIDLENANTYNNINNIFTISWTNSTLPAYPCPKSTIHNLYAKIADLTKENGGISASPSHLLVKVTSPEFRIKGVGLRLTASCGGSASTEGPMSKLSPKLRNAIDELRFNYGDVIKYEIHKDMFHAPRGGNTRDLDLSLLTIDGHVPPRDGFLGFDPKSQIIFGLALDENEVKSNEFQIVARDPETGGDISDAFVVNFGQDYRSPNFEISVSLVLVSDSEMDTETRVQVGERIVSAMLNGTDTSCLRVLGIKRYLYNPYRYERNKRNFSAYSGKNNQHQNSDPIASYLRLEGYNENMKKLRELSTIVDKELLGYQSFQPSDRFAAEYSQQYYYEYIWTNSSEEMMNSTGCPTEAVQKSIVEPIFGNPNGYRAIKERFEPEYTLLHIGFKPVKRCLGILSERELGEKPIIITPTTVKTTTVPSIYPTPPTGRPSEVEEKFDEDYYMRTIVPALITIIIMIIFCCTLLVVLIRYRRKQEKARFEVSGVLRASNGFLADRETFLQKGRVPVILESELQQQFLNQQRLISPVIMPPQDQYKQLPLQQMTPLRQANKTYHGYINPTANLQFHHHHQQQQQQHQQQQHQRIQPPPYFGSGH